MTLLTTRNCECIHKVWMGAKKPTHCPHGNRYVSEKQARPKKRSSGLKSGRGFAASPAQQKKAKGLPCVACGWEEESGLDPAHLWPRSAGGCDDPLCVIPLCRECHRRFDDPSCPVDLLPRLIDKGYWPEIAHVIEAHHVSPTQLLERLTGEKWEPVSSPQTRKAA